MQAEMFASAGQSAPRAWAEMDGLYRYALGREWGVGHGRACWIMLNPSTADAEIDDPTIRRCISFSRGWGYAGLVVVNLFALRSTDPANLLTATDPIGPLNDARIANEAAQADAVIVAWGAHSMAVGRSRKVADILRDSGRTGTALGFTKDGHPRHPLYVKGDAMRQGWPR